MNNELISLRKEIFQSSLPPDFEVECRIHETMKRLEDACKNGHKEIRTQMAQHAAQLIAVKKTITPKVWRNL